MLPIIHKAPIAVESTQAIKKITLGDPAYLALNDDETISVFVMLPSRLPFGFGKAKSLEIGKINGSEQMALMLALKKRAEIRVKIIEIVPHYINQSGRDSIYISVWGHLDDFTLQEPPRRIFSRSRINDSVDSSQKS